MKDSVTIKKVIIIGVRGFIGSHLKTYLENKGYHVYGADVVVDYVAKNYFLIDATNGGFESVFREQAFDLCINCSGAASVPDSIRNPRRDYYLNTSNVFSLLNAIRDRQPNCRFINLSSAAVYGNPTSLPVAEEAIPRPLSPYGYHKYMSETICREFYEQFGLATCSLRIFSAYGEGLTKQIFWDLYQKSKAKRKVELFGSGNETRDFIYVLDLVRLIELIAIHGEFHGEAVNAASGIETSIRSAAETFFSYYPDPPQIRFTQTERQGDPSRWVADISKIKENYNYSPEFTLEEGLRRYYQWVQQKEKQ
ncbi:dTDP-glucose 4,6-dehydratase/UDP-glucose 4-epimerase [Imperialibacter sp. EC-SDR9]|nr:dTDP-glucose 4,6-dehydratase/UDP-glucose 4-epimerase [Imperialibacter sp. 89]CAD5261275.1 dTDP-glucose 4,6-dehydratase/UDP-glucose 4-epimerase [Imperialibacter sp. 75]VVT03484.1 dTDP-glucose 4,6-dehydratase/UDP-glucose 4-epimerase [Imperialibacter sp. EC-SDR9]